MNDNNSRITEEIRMPDIETKTTIPVETGGKNKYMYDRRLKKTVICHPVLYFLAQMKTQGKDIAKWIETLTGHSIEIPGTGTFSLDEIKYYYRKLLFLENAGYFSKISQDKILTRKLTADSVRVTLANLTQVTFELTDACQMDCFYCGYGKFYDNYDKRENKHMDFPMIKQMVDYLDEQVNTPLNRSHNMPLFFGFYGGEPLLDFHLIEETVLYVNRLKWLHNIVRFTVTTNGLLLDKYMDFMVEHDFNIFISLDGDEKNDAYRVLKNGAPTYERVLANVETLQKKYPDFFKRRVFFNAVLHNKNSVEEIFNYFNNRFDKKPGILSLNTGGIREDQADEFWKTYVNEKESLYNSEDYSKIEQEMFIKLPTIQAASNFLFSSIDFYYDDYNHFFLSEKVPERYPSDTCSPFSKKLFLTVNGKILACERIGQQFELGQLTPEGIVLDFQEIADKYNNWFSSIRKQCRSCYIFDRCSQCIFYLDLKNGKPVCGNILDFVNYSRFVSNYFNYFEKKAGLFDRILKEVMIE
jgi:uncharacterized protein